MIDDDNYKEFTKILLRAGMDPNDYDQNLKICLIHRQVLGSKFSKLTWMNRCYYPTHSSDRFFEPSEILKVSHDEAFMALKTGNTNLPLDLPICPECHRVACAGFGSPGSSGGIYSPLEGGDGDSEHGADMESLDSSTSTQGEESIFDQMMDAFNHYLEVCGLDKFEKRYRLKSVVLEDLHGTTRKGKILKGVGLGVCAVLNTFTQLEHDRIQIYRHLKRSGIIEEYLGVATQMVSELREILLAYNQANNYPIRIQILSVVANNYTFAQLNTFNLEPQPLEEDEEVQMTLKSDLKWCPPLTRWTFNNAKDHYIKHGYGLVPVIRAKRVMWKFDKKTIQTIIDFVM